MHSSVPCQCMVIIIGVSIQMMTVDLKSKVFLQVLNGGKHLIVLVAIAESNLYRPVQQFHNKMPTCSNAIICASEHESVFKPLFIIQ